MRKTFFLVSQTWHGTCSICLLCCTALWFSSVASVTGPVYNIFRNTLQGWVALLLESSSLCHIQEKKPFGLGLESLVVAACSIHGLNCGALVSCSVACGLGKTLIAASRHSW